MRKVEKLYDIDIKENYIYQLDKSILEILLKDHSSKKNIVWATDTYVGRGSGYEPQDYITVKAITGLFGNVIKPRTKKSKREQQIRIKKKAEVFTPSWVCNKQNNLIDNAWFGREGVFNIETDKGWTTNYDTIVFPNTEGKTWQDYVKANRLEITCGEAPYLASRYDTVSGEWLDVKNRIGLLDRKLRVISENIAGESDWVNWALEAFKATYGFEWQGDSVLIARENLLFTFIDYYVDKFNSQPNKNLLIELSKIISWNIWQMDGLKFVIPDSCNPRKSQQLSLFDEENEMPQPCEGCLKNNPHKHKGIYCKIMDWETNKTVKFLSLIGAKK